MTIKNTIAEYIWYDAQGNLRSKTKVMPKIIDDNPIFPEWNFDGSSTGLTFGFNSDIALKPVSFYKDPFRRTWTNSDCYLVMCTCYNINGTPHESNYRVVCEDVFERAKDHEAWFGIEQEYFIMDKNSDSKEYPEKPMGWISHKTISHKFETQTIPINNNSGLTTTPSYCGVGDDRISGRFIMEDHMEHCLYAGIAICGMNLEVVKGQGEFQIGPITALDIGDQLWVARYILYRIAEKYGLTISINDKPVTIIEANGSGCHTNFSTKNMRENDNGYDFIIEACEKICKKTNLNPQKYLEEYGNIEENKKRLTGHHETSSWEKCEFDLSHRGKSIRIPYLAHKNKGKKGNNNYLEDRRPGSDCDPYRVVTQLIKTVCLDE
jgi:glutamine synthetase